MLFLARFWQRRGILGHVPLGSDTLSNRRLSTRVTRWNLLGFWCVYATDTHTALLERWGTHGGISPVSVSQRPSSKFRSLNLWGWFPAYQSLNSYLTHTLRVNHLSPPVLNFSLTCCRMFWAHYCRHASMTSAPCVTPAELVGWFWGILDWIFLQSRWHMPHMP